MANILVSLEIPIPVDKIVAAPALTFTKWLPTGDKHAITVNEDSIELKLWFNIHSTAWASEVQEIDLDRHINVLAHRIYADIVVNGVNDNLVEYMQNRDYGEPTNPENRQLQEEYDELAWRIISLSLRTLNRLLGFIKSRWGQYWLLDYEYDRGTMYSYYATFKGKATIDNVQWFRFSPSSIDFRKLEWVSDTRYIRHEDWNEIQDYVVSKKKPPLVGSLLATAESLAANGHSRSAITEAITALEVALYGFALKPNVDSIFPQELRDRVGIQTLKKQIEHMGLTASINYLLPVLLPETVLPKAIIDGCRVAISQRQNVVHNGQREVQGDILVLCLKSVRQMCELLESITQNPNVLMRINET